MIYPSEESILHVRLNPDDELAHHRGWRPKDNWKQQAWDDYVARIGEEEYQRLLREEREWKERFKK